MIELSDSCYDAIKEIIFDLLKEWKKLYDEREAVEKRVAGEILQMVLAKQTACIDDGFCTTDILAMEIRKKYCVE